MSDTWSEEERRWQADKRDFVADWRDDVAHGRDGDGDSRELIADERERLTDEREAALDELEQYLYERARELGLPIEAADEERARSATERSRDADSRKSASLARSEARKSRETAQAARLTASQRRGTATPVTGLAMAFSDLALNLYDSDNFDDVLVRIVTATVSAVEGCAMASICIREGVDEFRTGASTDVGAKRADETQYEAAEGPCIDAIDEALVHVRDFPDDRWPNLGSKLKDAGVDSAVSYRLAATPPADDDHFAGSLSAYAGATDAFNAEAREIGLILAAHASLAARSKQERDGLEQMGRQLHEALSSRDVIGQAKGILMERLRLTPEDAFDALRRSSQRLNVKLREVAEQLARTGEFEDSE